MQPFKHSEGNCQADWTVKKPSARVGAIAFLLEGGIVSQICNCSCHQNGSPGGLVKMHICNCHWCDFCHLNILGDMDEHARTCVARNIVETLKAAQLSRVSPSGSLKLWECTCDCHKLEGAVHCMACCNPCPTCGAKVKFGFESEHAQDCSPRNRVLHTDGVDLAP